MSDAATPVLEATGLVKLFGRVVGLRGVDLTLYPGEVLAVIGDNGAGKSTLIKCLSGAMTPDAGEIKVEGKKVSFRTTQDAREVGIETVYQTLAVAPALDIASNLYLAREIRRKGFAGQRPADAGHEGDAGRRHDHIKDLGISHPAEHQPGGRDAVRWPTPGRGGRSGGDLRRQGGHPGRADGGARCARNQPGAAPDHRDA